MSLRLKLILALVTLASAATIAIGVSSYASTGDRLTAEVDRSLTEAAGLLARLGRRPAFDPGQGGEFFQRPRSFEQILLQLVDGDGKVLASPIGLQFPVTDVERQLAAAPQPRSEGPGTAEIAGERYRILTLSLGGRRGAIQIGRSLAEADRLLDSLRNRTVATVALVMAAATGLGWLISRQVTRRLETLTAVAEQVSATGRLDHEVPVTGTDEAGRLGSAFNQMLSALARSRQEQRRLVEDAGHELRTPLTSLRTNVSLLRRHDQLPPEMRTKVLEDLDSETGELATLVGELIELATEGRSDEATEPVELGPLVERAAAVVGRRTARALAVEADTSRGEGRPLALERAISNLLDNAVKFSPPDSGIAIRVSGGRVEVCDRGSGIAEEDLARIFDRFYRAVGARSQPGSGLGLAIVRQVIESHGGRVFAENRPGGGACIGFELPGFQPNSNPGMIHS